MANKLAVQIEIIPNMYQMGLFKKTLESRKRLRLTALFSFLGLCIVYLGIGLFIRYISVWFWINAICIIFALICSIVVGYLFALTIGDVVFHGPWRKKMILGDKFIPDELEEQKALLKNKSIVFILIWVFAIVFLFIGCDFCTGGNIRWYQNIGNTISSMKSPDPAERLYIVKTISNSYYSKKWSDETVREMTRSLISDENAEVQAWASYLSGRAKIVEATDDLIALVKNSEADTIARREAVIALGRMEWKAARASLFSVMKKTFDQNHADKELVPAILYAFYMLKDPMAAQGTLQMLDACLEKRDCSSEVLQYAFFYLKSLRVQEAATLCFKYLDTPDITAEMRCYASDILRFTASKNDVPRLKEEFKKASSSADCPVIYRKYHEEPAVILFEHDYIRALFVRSVGNIMNPADFDWIWMIGSDEKENLQTRKVAEMYTRAMQEKGIVK